VNLTLHGNRRNNPEYCVLCHNPANTDISQVPAGKTPQGINMALMVHRIHDGVNVVPSGGKPYTVYGHGGRLVDFSDVLYPAFSPTGGATYLQNCSLCHVNGSEQTLPVGLNPVADPQGWINPVQPASSACSGCHVSKPEASHFLSNTDALGESCTVCHAAGSAYGVDAVHTK
jgi:OmcA/MtrC family decaheme c-type cytochrome